MSDGPRAQVATVGLAVGVAILGLLVGGVLTFGAGAFLRALGIVPGIATLLVVALLLTQGVAFGGTALVYLRLRGLTLDFVPVSIPTVRDLVWIGAGYVLALLGAFGGMVLIFLLGAPAAQNQVGEIAIENPDVLLLLVPFSFLLIGPGEELLFRGIVQGTIREVLSPVPAIVIASAIFAAVHFVALSGGVGGRLVTIGVLFLPSLVFGTAYELSDNLVVPAVVHGAYNATLFAIVYVSLRFAEAAPA